MSGSWSPGPVPVEVAVDAPSRLGTGLDVGEAVIARLRDACAHVSVDEGERTEAGRDWWPLALVWAQRDGAVPARPQVIARPETAGEVAAVLRVCDEAMVPVTAAGGRSGVLGGSVPVHGGVALDLTRLTGVIDVDPTSLTVDVLAGTGGPVLEQALRAAGCTLGHWPQSFSISTVGGWLACRSAGQLSTRYGKIEDMVVGLEVALADGRLVRTGGRAPRSSIGPDLTQLFVGSEGTLGVITEARLRIHPAPAHELRAAWTVASFDEGIEVCRSVLRRGATPAVLRLYDQAESQRSYGIDDRCVLLALDEGDPRIVEATMAVVREEAARAGAEERGEDLVLSWLEHRNDVSALGALIERGIAVDTAEVAGPWGVLPALYDDAVGAARAVDGTLACSAHLSHSYLDGACLYFSFGGRPSEGPGALESWHRGVWDAIEGAALDHGAAIAHHHGIGLARSRYVAPALGSAAAVLGSLKEALDPNGILNPGKLGFASQFGEVGWP